MGTNIRQTAPHLNVDGRGRGEIKGIARVKFRPGQADEWKRLAAEAMEIVRT